MIIRLGRLTPGYFRLLQRQVSGEVRMQPQSSLINPIAMTMATVGTGVSLYSTRQMAERRFVVEAERVREFVVSAEGKSKCPGRKI